MSITRLYFNSLFVFTVLLFATQAFAFEGRPGNIKCSEDVVVREILGPKQELPMSAIIEVNDETIFDLVEKEPVLLVDFYASWCGACRMSAPMFAKVAAEEGIKIVKIDVEKNPKIKEMVELPGLPSIGFFKNGEPVDLVNTTKEEAFREFIQKMKA